MHFMSILNTVCLFVALTNANAPEVGGAKPHEHPVHRKGHKRDWGCWPGWVSVETNCYEHANMALGQCIKGTKFANNRCEKENWGAHSCEYGNDGNILICDNHNIHGRLIWSHYANCSRPDDGKSESCSNCECNEYRLPREFVPCQQCPFLMPGDQHPCWANMQEEGCYDRWVDLHQGDKEDLPPKMAKNCKEEDGDDCPRFHLGPKYSEGCKEIEGNPSGSSFCGGVVGDESWPKPR